MGCRPHLRKFSGAVFHRALLDPVRPPTSFFEDEFRAFAAAEASAPLPRDPILFYGSSSIRLWTSLADDFPGVPLVNRGFGGSTMRDCVQEFERLVVPVAPRAIVFYAGDNDLAQGASPERVRGLLQDFVTRVDDRFGLLPLVVISIKVSPCRTGNAANILRANELLRGTVEQWPNARYLDVCSLMLDPAGRVRREYFCEDWLHLSRAGYELWTRELRTCLGALGLWP